MQKPDAVVLNNSYHDRKLLWPYHMDRARIILAGEIPPPSLVEIDPTDEGCNQSCVFCCFHSSVHRKIVLIDVEMMLGFVAEAYDHGAYAFELVGGGEPTNHPRIADIIRGIASLAKPGRERPHIGMVTNGVRLERVLDVADNLDFVRVGFDAPNSDIYTTLHGIPKGSSHFAKMIGNVRNLIAKVGHERVRFGYLVVPPHNHSRDTIRAAVELAHEIGVEHVAFRPAYGGEGATTEMWQEASDAILEAQREHRPGFILGGSGGSWSYVLGVHTHPTGVCRTRPMVLVVKADGTIPTCFLYRERTAERPVIGHISAGFADVWYSESHRNSIRSVDRTTCPDVCKLYRTERTLEQLEASPGNIPHIDETELDDPHFI